MNILLNISSMGVGGEQRAASILTDYFVKSGHNVSILTFKKPIENKMEFNNKIIIRVYDKNNNNFYRLQSIRKCIKFYNPDIVIGFGIIPSILCSLASIGLNTPVIVCERNDPEIYPFHWKRIRNIAYFFATAAIFQTNEASKCFSKLYFKSRMVIPNPIRSDIELYRKPINNRKKVIVNISRLTKAKNQDQIINAFYKIHEKHKEYRLELYGEGENRENLEKLIENKELSEYITIHDATKDIYKIISEYQIFVLTSSHEGYPNSLAEAMALGLAVISVDCRIGGPKDMIQNNFNGILIPTNNEQALVESIEDLIENVEKRELLSRNAMNIADDNRIDVIGKIWEGYMYEVIEIFEKTT